jgi:transcription elongation factor S-II
MTSDLLWNSYFHNLYLNRAVTIFCNLNPDSYLKNTTLLHRLISGELTEFALASADPQQLNPERWKEIVDEYGEDINKDIFKIDTNIEGMFKCGKCKTNKTTYYQLQTRSADEPLTTFVSCVNCGNKWKFN